MKKQAQGVREPFVRMVKRDTMPAWRQALVYALAVVLALVACSITIVLFTGLNPIDVYATMWESTFGAPGVAWKNRLITIWTTVRDTMILLCVALALAPAFRMRFWNIGGEGQILVGGLATAFVMRQFGDMIPSWALLCGHGECKPVGRACVGVVAGSV